MEPLDNRKSGKLDQVFLWVLSTFNYLYFTLLGFPVTSAEKGPHSVTHVGWILGYICLFFLIPYDFTDKVSQRLTVQKKNVTHCSIIIPQTVIPFSIQILIFLFYLSLSAVLFAPPLSLPCCHQSPEDPIFSFSSSSAPNGHIFCVNFLYHLCQAVGHVRTSPEPGQSVHRSQHSPAQRVLGLWVSCSWVGVSILLRCHTFSLLSFTGVWWFCLNTGIRMIFS